MAYAGIIFVGVLFCAVASANVTLSEVGPQEVNETNPTVHQHLSADNDTDEGAGDVSENATQPPLTNRVTLPSGFSSTHPPLVHGRVNMDMKEATSNNTSSPPSPPPPMPMNVNSNSMEHTTTKSPPTMPSTPSTTSHPPLVHPTMEPTLGKSEVSKTQQGHNGSKGLHSSAILLFACIALAKSYVTC